LHAGRVRACPLALSRLRPLWQTWLWGERLWFEARKTGSKRGMQPGKTPRRDGLLLIKSARRAARADEADDASNHQNDYPIARERRLAESRTISPPTQHPIARARVRAQTRINMPRISCVPICSNATKLRRFNGRRSQLLMSSVRGRSPPDPSAAVGRSFPLRRAGDLRSDRPCLADG